MAWIGTLLLGAYHGINPGMGWLFAVGLGLQQGSGRAVWRALPPLALGHALSVAAVLGLAAAARVVVPLEWLKVGVAAVLFYLGVARLVRHRHPRFGGMQVGWRDLTVWSFLMASAHGAGLMVLPLLLGMSAEVSADLSPHAHHAQAAGSGAGWMQLGAVGVHTLAYLLVTGVVAWLVYWKFGVALLRKAWINLDLAWAAALVVTGIVVLLS